MATGTIVTAWKDANSAYAAVSVNEGGTHGVVEYTASTPLQDSQGAVKSLATIKAELTAGVSAQRPGVGPQAIAVSGTITV